MAERRIVSVVFADVVGFTTLSESMDPEDVATIQDAYFAAVRDVLERYGGVLEKFIGDAAVAVFGIPRTRDDDAERAVRAALALHRSVAGLSAALGLEPGTLALRVGVNTGEVAFTPEDGGAGRVTGDTVNVAARLESAAEPGRVLLGPDTALAVAAAFDLEPAGSLDLKGKSEGLRAHLVRAQRPSPSRDAALGRMRAPTIGREAELERLAGILRESGEDGRLVVVVARPGVGKSRLVAEFERRTLQGGVPVRSWRAGVDAAEGPFAPIRSLLLEALQGSGITPDDRITTEALLAERLGAAGVAAARDVARESAALLTGSPTASEVEVKIGAWRAALQALKGHTTAIWLVEDVHDAAPELLEFLQQAVRSSPGLLVLTTARPSLIPRAPAFVEAAHHRLDLDSLPIVETVDLIRALVGDALAGEFEQRVAETADGTPLFVEELLRMWLAVGILAERAGVVELVGRPDEVGIPTTIRSLYAAQLDDLPDEARSVALRGSVVGSTFALPAVEELVGGHAREGTYGLRTRDLVAGPVPDVLGEAYAYRHSLLAEVAYQSLARSERGDLHVALARWLEGRQGSVALADEIAHHYDAALTSAPALAQTIGGLSRQELLDAVLRCRRNAAESAMAAAAFVTASEHARRLVELSDEGTLVRAEGLRLWGQSLVFGDDIEAGIEHLRAAIDVYAALSDRTPAAVVTGWVSAAAALSRAHYERVEFEQAEAVVEGALDALPDLSPTDAARLRLRRTIAIVGQRDQETPQHYLDDVEHALEVAIEQGDQGLELDALEAMNYYDGDVSRATSRSARIEHLSRDLGRWRTHLAARRSRLVLAATADPEGQVTELEELVRTAESLGLGDVHAFALYSLSEAHLMAGDLDAATAAAKAAVRVGDAHGAVRAGVRASFVLAAVCGLRPDDELAASVADWVGARAHAFPSEPSPFARLMFEACKVWTGRVIGLDFRAEAEDVDLYALGSIQAAAETIVAGMLREGRAPEVRAIVDRGWADHASDPVAVRASTASLELVEAWLALAQGDVAGAEAAARRALSLATEVGAPVSVVAAIRVLEAVGAATPAELEHRIRTELEIGITAPVLPPVVPAAG